MVTCQSSELGWEVTVELPTDFLSLGWGSVTQWRIKMLNFGNKQNRETLSFGKKQGGKNIFSLTI